MNWISIIGLVLIGFGMVVLAIAPIYFANLKKRLSIIIIVGALVQIVGMFINGIGQQKRINEDKAVYKENMETFYTRLKIISDNLGISDSLYFNQKDQLQNLNRDFDKWANDFLGKKDSLSLTIQRNIIDEKQNELSLNKKWLPVYNDLFNFTKKTIDAYNKNVNNPITYQNLQPLTDLFDIDGNTFFSFEIDFSDARQWTFSLKNSSNKLPDIILYHCYKYGPCGNDQVELSISINPLNNQIKLIALQKKIKQSNLQSTYDLNKSPDILNDIFRNLIEYELCLRD